MSVLSEQEHCLICQYYLSKNIASYVSIILARTLLIGQYCPEQEHCLICQDYLKTTLPHISVLSEQMSVLSEQEHCLICQYYLSKNIASCLYYLSRKELCLICQYYLSKNIASHVSIILSKNIASYISITVANVSII